MVRVLIAEPEPDLRLFAEQALIELGHEALLAADDAAPAGVDVLLAADSPDSLALAHALRQRDSALPIVCMSGRRPRAELRALRPVVHLMKPFSLARLERALADALAGSD